MSLSKIGKVSNAVKLLNTAATSGDIATGISSLSNSLRAAGNMSAGVNWISKYGKVLDSGIAYQALKQAFPEESLTEDMLAKIGYTANGAGKVGNASKFSSVGSTFAGLGAFLKSIWPVLAVVGGIAAGTAAWKWADDKFTITKATAKKHSDESAQAYQNAKTELSTKQSQYDTNQDRIHELRATQNRTSDENAELSQLTKENSLLGTQVSVQKKLVNAKAQQQAIDADMNLNKKYTTSQAVANEYSDSVVAKQEDIVEETTRKVNELAELQKKRDAAYQKLDQMSADDEGFTEQQNIANQMDDRVSKKQSEIADAMDEISDDYNRLFDEDTGALINPKTKDTAKSVEDLFSLYGRVTDSAQEETDRINNIFAKAKFDGVEDQLVNAGKSGGTDAVKAKISEIDGLQEALDNAGISADTLASNIMAIARPDEKNLEGIKENLKDIFDISADLNEGDNFVGPSGNLYNFFKDKTDKQIEDFWNYYSDQGLDGSDWNYMDLASNFNKSQEKAKIEAESKTFSSLFKNSAEDTATDLDTITDNFQTDMSNIKSSMDSIKSGTFQNSDITDLIQQFPELATETDNLQQGLQNLAFDKASDAIGKIRDSVKDVTDPKQLAAADKYIQSIMDTMDLSGFDMSNAKSAILGNLTKNLADKHMASVTTPNLVNQLMSEYGNDEIAVQAIMKLSLDPSMANADLDTWKSKIEDTKVQIQLDTSAKNLDNLSKELTRLQTDASDQQTRLNNKSAYNMKATASDYTNLIENGDKQIENLNNQIKEYQNNIDALKNSKGLSPLSDEDNEQIKQWQDQIQASQMSIENMKASGTNNGTIKLTVNGNATDNIAVKGLGSAAYTASGAYATSAQGAKADAAMPKAGGTFTGTVTLAADPTDALQPTTKQYVDAKISSSIAASDAMVFKGTLGTNGTVTALPTSSVVVGDTYKVITQVSVDADNSYTGAAVAAKVGDLVVAMSNDPKWIVVPSGDEIVTTVKYSTTTQNLTTSAQSGAITVGEAATKQVDSSITAASTSTKLPTSKAVAAFVEGKGYKTTDQKVKNTLNATAKAYVTGTTSATTGIGEQVFDTGVYLDTTAGKLVATTFAGALQGNATTATSAAACTGNAASATKLAASRNFSLTGGAVADAVAFNGGGNVALSVKSLNTDYLTNGANTLILNCGTSV